jgi:hypothetical protein
MAFNGQNLKLPPSATHSSHAPEFPALGGRKSMADSIANCSRWDYENAIIVGNE